MRIFFVTLFYPPERIAGTENYTRCLASELSRSGHEVHVICASEWDSGPSYWSGVRQETVEGVTIHRLQLNWSLADDPNKILYDSEQVERWLGQLFDRERPDVVHVTSTMTLGVGALRAAYRAGIAMVLTLMDFWFLCPKAILTRANGDPCDGQTSAWECQECLLQSSGLFRRLGAVLPAQAQAEVWGFISRHPQLSRRRGARGMALNMEDRKSSLFEALTYPDRILAHSHFVQEVFRSAGSPKKVEYLLNGHDLSWTKDISERKGNGPLRFAFLGQLEPLKGPDLLIQAFLKADVGDRACLEVWGGAVCRSDYSERLEKMAAGRQDISLHGRYERSQLPEILGRSNVVVVPSRWYENAPLVIQEAFAAKVPVIATDLGGMAESVTDNQDGLLFPLNDAEALARQLRRLVEDPQLLLRLRSNIKPVKTISQETTELQSLYRELIDAALETREAGAVTTAKDASS